MGNILAIALLVFGLIIVLLLGVAMTSHHCDKCGEDLVELTGDRWYCHKCGKHYHIGKLGLGKQIEF